MRFVLSGYHWDHLAGAAIVNHYDVAGGWRKPLAFSWWLAGEQQTANQRRLRGAHLSGAAATPETAPAVEVWAVSDDEVASGGDALGWPGVGAMSPKPHQVCGASCHHSKGRGDEDQAHRKDPDQLEPAVLGHAGDQVAPLNSTTAPTGPRMVVSTPSHTRADACTCFPSAAAPGLMVADPAGII